LIEAASVREIDAYNRKLAAQGEPTLPKIVIVIDELNDLMMSARDAVEAAICRIAQKARAAGMHLIIGTQRPSVDVITGVIKANIPSRIAFHVSSQVDSRTILDMVGAEKLLNKGDMLVSLVNFTCRVQGSLVEDSEVEAVTDFLKENAKEKGSVYDDEIMESIQHETEKYKQSNSKRGDRDEDYEPAGDDILDDMKFRQAVELAISAQKISTSLIQRKMSLGFGKAAKYIDAMEDLGIVSAPNGQKPRDVLITYDEYMQMVARRG
ncbi:MAG: DNA translocase FtsK, partial [Clostridia bacterium]|nr:DNA translocase FtsK [Clostridia bacterium]